MARRTLVHSGAVVVQLKGLRSGGLEFGFCPVLPPLHVQREGGLLGVVIRTEVPAATVQENLLNTAV